MKNFFQRIFYKKMKSSIYNPLGQRSQVTEIMKKSRPARPPEFVKVEGLLLGFFLKVLTGLYSPVETRSVFEDIIKKFVGESWERNI